MKLIDNVNERLRDDLASHVSKGGRLSIAAACFSMYAYEELKKQLEGLKEFRFLFTSPTFTKEHDDKQKREFYIPRLGREKSLCGSEFEIRLRNEMNQRAIARECAEWIRKKAVFKSNSTNECMQGFAVAEGKSSIAYSPVNGFTTVDLGCEKGNNAFSLVTQMDAPFSQEFLRKFDELWGNSEKLRDVTEIVVENIENAYKENSPEFIYYMTLYHVFSEFLSDVSEDVLPDERTGFRESRIWDMLYDFQSEAALAIIHKLERYNGCILADSVGLGKTFTALAVIKYYENKNKNVLVLCPKKLADNWNTYKGNYLNNPIAADRLNYDVLFHTDLSRNGGSSNGLDLGRLNWSNYDLVVIDESHNFRNGYGTDINQHENRYQRLMEQVIQKGVKTKVLMLSATPVNNRFNDLKNQLALAYEGNSELIDKELDTIRSVDEIFRQAQTAFNAWSKLPAEERTTQRLLQSLDFDFFQVLDSVTIARSRKHIERYYDAGKIGKFPRRLKPISIRPSLSKCSGVISFNEIYGRLNLLTLCVYTPSDYILPSRLEKYEASLPKQGRGGLSQRGREQGVKRLMNINLLKRLESSVHSFRLTLKRILDVIEEKIERIDAFLKNGASVIDATEIDGDSLDYDDANLEGVTVGGKVQIDLRDMDHVTWKRELETDAQVLRGLLADVEKVTPDLDEKLQDLLRCLDGKISQPINPGNRKVLVFTAFSDTAEYLYEHVSAHMKQHYGLETALVTGAMAGRSTLRNLGGDFNTLLTCFSPVSKGRDVLMPKGGADIDILIATDCISEGQNLQDCDFLVNYDIHWNPVRIIQRFGRIDRIGSRNESIQLVNFWPDMDLDEYINLKARVETPG